jgi:hypothetical protein
VSLSRHEPYHELVANYPAASPSRRPVHTATGASGLPRQPRISTGSVAINFQDSIPPVFREISSAPHHKRGIWLRCTFLGVGQNHPQAGGMGFFDPRAILLYDAMDMEG